MEANENVARNPEAISVYPDWAVVKQWAKSTFTKGRVADIALSTSTMAVLGVVLFSLSQAVQNCTITGLGMTAFGYF